MRKADNTVPELGQRVRLRVLTERVVDGIGQILGAVLLALLGQQAGERDLQNTIFIHDGDTLHDAG